VPSWPRSTGRWRRTWKRRSRRPFVANLVKKEGKNVEIGNGDEAGAVRRDLEAAIFTVAKVQRKERRRHPVPPFITSKLQQEAFKKLRYSVKKTMQVAQRLYEGVELGPDGSVGLITYMRTDSTRISDDALTAVREKIGQTYGNEYLPEKPNFYRSKKDAQDAHEAIRPSYPERDPDSIKKYLSKDEYALYKLIWNRFVASQMLPAVYDETIADIEAAAYLLRAKGSTLKFKGFLAVYEETPDEKQETKPKDETGRRGGRHRARRRGRAAARRSRKATASPLKKLDTDQHFTQPPPRFSEASLVKELEENGIGRPLHLRVHHRAPSKRATTWRSARPSSTRPSSASW
jgi:DNA topoisomerase-1